MNPLSAQPRVCPADGPPGLPWLPDEAVALHGSDLLNAAPERLLGVASAPSV